MNTLLIPLLGVLASSDPVPTADRTTAGWVAFGVFIGLAIAVAFLGWSLTKHLKKAKANAASGVFGEVEATEDSPADAESGTTA